MAAVCHVPPFMSAGKRRFPAQAAYLDSCVQQTTTSSKKSGKKIKQRETLLHILRPQSASENSIYGMKLPYDVLYLLPTRPGREASKEIKEILDRLPNLEGVHLNRRWVPIDASMKQLWELWTCLRSETSAPLPVADTDVDTMQDENLWRMAAEELCMLSSGESPPVSPHPKKRARVTTRRRR